MSSSSLYCRQERLDRIAFLCESNFELSRTELSAVEFGFLSSKRVGNLVFGTESAELGDSSFVGDR